MDGLFHPFHFIEKKIKRIPVHAWKNCKVLRLLYTQGRRIFYHSHGICFRELHIEKNCFKVEWALLLFLDMGPNQVRIMDQMVGRLIVDPDQVSFIKTDTYEGIGQRLIGFCIYISVVTRRFATGDVFFGYLQWTFWIFPVLIWLPLPKYGGHHFFFKIAR